MHVFRSWDKVVCGVPMFAKRCLVEILEFEMRGWKAGMAIYCHLSGQAARIWV